MNGTRYQRLGPAVVGIGAVRNLDHVERAVLDRPRWQRVNLDQPRETRLQRNDRLEDLGVAVVVPENAAFAVPGKLPIIPGRFGARDNGQANQHERPDRTHSTFSRRRPRPSRILRIAPTAVGSNCVPDAFLRRKIASGFPRAFRYGRSVVIAS